MLAREKTTRLPQATILVVDDDPDDQLLLGLALSELLPNLFIRYAGNGQEALDYLQTGEAQPLLIVTDMHMPLLDGAELIRCLRDRVQTQQVPMVVLSSQSNAVDQERCYQAGANSYLAKPQSYADEVRLVDQLIRAWLPPTTGPVTQQTTVSSSR